MMVEIMAAFFVGLVSGTLVGMGIVLRATGKAVPLESSKDFDAWVTSARYPKAFAVMKISSTSQNIGQLSTGEHRARALAKEELAKAKEGDLIDLVEYRAYRKVDF